MKKLILTAVILSTLTMCKKAELEQNKIDVENAKRSIIEDDVEPLDSEEAIVVRRTLNLSDDSYDPDIA